MRFLKFPRGKEQKMSPASNKLGSSLLEIHVTRAPRPPSLSRAKAGAAGTAQGVSVWARLPAVHTSRLTTLFLCQKLLTQVLYV